MEKRDSFTRVLAISGIILVWLPLLAPVVFTIIRLVGAGMFRFDYLLPAELFPVTVVGGALLAWAAQRAKAYLNPIIWSLGLMVGLLVGGQLLAIATGLDSAGPEESGLAMPVVLATIVLSILAQVFAGIFGIFLIRKLLRPRDQARI